MKFYLYRFRPADKRPKRREHKAEAGCHGSVKRYVKPILQKPYESRNLRAKASMQALKIASHRFQGYGFEIDEPEDSSQELFSGFFMGIFYQFR